MVIIYQNDILIHEISWIVEICSPEDESSAMNPNEDFFKTSIVIFC